ncbi:MAG: serine/threonine-protein phosphatase [Phycisphaerales bacterium]|nr:serine/threonine-protein phosphatase [Phycisphaerales bacterium]
MGIPDHEIELSFARSQVALLKQLNETLRKDIVCLQDELVKAAEVQQAYMSSSIPNIPGLNIETLWKPCNVVSGDVYDIRQLNSDEVSIFIGDSIGHGVSAAMLGMMAIRTLAANRLVDGLAKSPADMLYALNDAICEKDGDAARFLTAFYAIYNFKTNDLTYCGAGHPAAIVSQPFGQPKMLESSGPLLGVFHDAIFENETIKLESNSKFVVYSDGFEHLVPESTDACKVPNYVQAIHEVCQSSVGKPLETIASKASNYIGHSSDDLTIVSMHVGSELFVKLAA